MIPSAVQAAITAADQAKSDVDSAVASLASRQSDAEAAQKALDDSQSDLAAKEAALAAAKQSLSAAVDSWLTPSATPSAVEAAPVTVGTVTVGAAGS